ncbi:MAG: hypothetical protein ABTS22_00190 [Accumulibacter sp.]|uniref:hypothetical protein n=1 Tax=Accumulibacter sp. TaxID=2053492 RepID=UPI001ACF5489|nr:hypothetical protein [Accumulibacter sp.]MBK8384701.1 hypothetical protein [Accumulibacter sp.]MBN8436770.1 hypothetical protein [Accumulibacter sp.]
MSTVRDRPGPVIGDGRMAWFSAVVSRVGQWFVRDLSGTAGWLWSPDARSYRRFSG